MYVCAKCGLKTSDGIICQICKNEPEVWKCEECEHELHDDEIENEYAIIKSNSSGLNVSINDGSLDTEEIRQIFYYFCSKCGYSKYL